MANDVTDPFPDHGESLDVGMKIGSLTDMPATLWQQMQKKCHATGLGDFGGAVRSAAASIDRFFEIRKVDSSEN